MATIEDVKNALSRFPDKTFSIKVVEVPKREIREQDEANVQWNHDGWVWCESSSVYYFRNDTEVLYIGKAKKFGARIKEHISSEDEKWQKDISDPTTVVGFIHADDFDLEAYLIEKLRTKHNTQHNR